MKKVIALTVLATLMTGCNAAKTAEEKFADACQAKLEQAIKENAQYSGWNTKDIQVTSSVLKEDIELAKKMEAQYGSYEEDTFFKYTAEFNNFTLKNGFNADVVSTATCVTTTTKWEGEIQEPSAENYMYKIKVNDKYLRLAI